MRSCVSFFTLLFFLSSCNFHKNHEEQNSAANDSVLLPAMPLDTSRTGPSYTKQEDSLLILNAPVNHIVKRVEVWRYDKEKYGAGKCLLASSQTFYGGGARTDSIFHGYSGEGQQDYIKQYNANGLLVQDDAVDQDIERHLLKYDEHRFITSDSSLYAMSVDQKLTVLDEMDIRYYLNTYNSNGKLIRKRVYRTPGKITEEDTYTYDGSGNLTNETGYAAFSNGDTTKYSTHYEYNGQNQKIKESGGGVFSNDKSYEYDEAGRLSRIVFSSGEHKYYYDKKGNVVIEEETWLQDGHLKTTYLRYKWSYYK